MPAGIIADSTNPSAAYPRLKNWHAVALLGLAVALFFSAILVQRAFLWDDVLTQTYPFRSFAATALAGHELPLWNPYAFGGMPFQADIQSAIFYLPNLALTLFVHDGHLPFYALEVMILLHFWLAGVGAFFLAREVGLEPVFALFSGMVFSLSGFMIVHTVHPVFVEEAAWLPIIALLFHRAMVRRSLAYATGAGLLFGHAVLAGAPQISLFIGFFLELIFLFFFVAEVRTKGFVSALRMIPIIAVTFLIAVGFDAIQLLPTYELIPLSDRATFSFQAAQQYRLSWMQLLSAVVPKVMGADGPRESTYWGSVDYGGFWETCFYLGIPALLAIIASFRLIRVNRYVQFCVALVVLSLLLAVGDQLFLHGFFFRFVPGFSRFRGPARIVLYLTLCGALLAGFGTREFMRLAGDHARRVELGALVAVGAVLLACFAVWIGVSVPPVAEPVHSRMLAYVRREAAWGIGFTLAGAATALLLTRRLVAPAVAVGLVLVVQFADIFQFGFQQNNGPLSADQYYETSRERLAPIVADASHEIFRVAGRDGRWVMVDRNQGMVDRVFQLEGYTPLALQRRLPPAPDIAQAYDMMNAKYRVVVDSSAGQMHFASFPTHLPRAYLVRETRVMDSAAVAPFMRSREFDPRRMVVLEQPLSANSSDGAVAPAGTATISHYSLNSIVVDVTTAQPAVLVLSEIFYPGWRAYVDGTPVTVLRANWNLRAVPLPAGARRVELRFEPASLRRGAWITLLTLVLAAVLLLSPRIRHRPLSTEH